MKIYKLSDMKSGWYVGNFEPSAFKTEQFEVNYRTHKAGEQWEHHYHEEITEVNLLVSGEMIMQGKRLKAGDIFVVEPYEVADPQFIMDCTVVCVKTPSVVGDKVVFETSKSSLDFNMDEEVRKMRDDEDNSSVEFNENLLEKFRKEIEEENSAEKRCKCGKSLYYNKVNMVK